jgi:hypothetical protein
LSNGKAAWIQGFPFDRLPGLNPSKIEREKNSSAEKFKSNSAFLPFAISYSGLERCMEKYNEQ